jgi:hydrogenase maturation protease
VNEVATLVGGVGELYQHDLDVGRRVVELLGAGDLPPGVEVEELFYGAVAVAQRIEDLRPDTVVLIGAVARDRPPGTVERRRVTAPDLPVAVRQQAVGDAVTGYVAIDLVVEVLVALLDELPPRMVTIELEPAVTGPGTELSAAAEAALPRLVEMAHGEIARAPLLALAARLRAVTAGDRLADTPARATLDALLDELDRYDRDERWGATFTLRDELRARIVTGDVSPDMDHRDWGLWWALIEELDRLGAADVRVPEL